MQPFCGNRIPLWEGNWAASIWPIVVLQAVQIPMLLCRNRGFEILDLGLVLPHEDDKGDIGNSGHPGIADQLRIEGESTRQAPPNNGWK